MEVRLFFLWSNPGLSAKERVKTRTCMDEILLFAALLSSEPATLFGCRSKRQSHAELCDWWLVSESRLSDPRAVNDCVVWQPWLRSLGGPESHAPERSMT